MVDTATVAQDILLVEDNPDDAELILRALAGSDLDSRVRHVWDGAEALEYLFHRGRFADRVGTPAPKVVVLDLKLPRMDGHEVLRAVRSHPSTSLIPVVILSSSAEEEDMVRGYSAGANSYVVKATDYVALSRTVRELGTYWIGVNEVPPPPEP